MKSCEEILKETEEKVTSEIEDCLSLMKADSSELKDSSTFGKSLRVFIALQKNLKELVSFIDKQEEEYIKAENEEKNQLWS